MVCHSSAWSEAFSSSTNQCEKGIIVEGRPDVSYWLGIGSSFTNLNPELIVNKSEPENEPSGQLFYHVNFVKFSAHRGDRVYSKRGPGAVPGPGMSLLSLERGIFVTKPMSVLLLSLMASLTDVGSQYSYG